MQRPSFKVMLSAGLLAAVGAMPAVAAGDEAACTGCHGAKGVSTVGSIPTLAGLSAVYLEAQMAAYQSDSRQCVPAGPSDMCAAAKKTTAAQVSATAAYFAAQHFLAAKQKTDPPRVKRGRAVHQLRCAACHSHAGRNAADNAGILGGQWQAYLGSAMTAFAASTRPQPAEMAEQIKQLSAEDVQGLLDFYASKGSR